jgi:hypothetical protein
LCFVTEDAEKGPERAAEAMRRVRLLVQDGPVLMQVLHSALGETYGPSAGDPQRETWLPWDRLELLLGKDLLHRRIREAAPAAANERTQEAFRLAQRYASGWRPQEGPAAFAIELGSDMLIPLDGAATS